MVNLCRAIPILPPELLTKLAKARRFLVEVGDHADEPYDRLCSYAELATIATFCSVVWGDTKWKIASNTAEEEPFPDLDEVRHDLWCRSAMGDVEEAEIENLDEVQVWQRAGHGLVNEVVASLKEVDEELASILSARFDE